MKYVSDMVDNDDPPECPTLAGAAFTEYSAELHRYLARRLAHPEDANDLAQETFLRLIRVERPERIRRPVAYLFSIAAHLIREFRLREDREHEHVTFDSETLEQAEETVPTAGNEEPGYRLNLEQQLVRGLLKLPRTQRAVLLLVKRDGLSHEEAARALNLSVHTIERYVVEATARMAQMGWDR